MSHTTWQLDKTLLNQELMKQLLYTQDNSSGQLHNTELNSNCYTISGAFPVSQSWNSQQDLPRETSTFSQEISMTVLVKVFGDNYPHLAVC